MDSKEIEQFVELLYPFFLERLKKESFFKNNLRMKNATVVSTEGAITVKFSYDNTTFPVQNWSGEELSAGDQVCIGYWIDLKNAVVMKKIN